MIKITQEEIRDFEDITRNKLCKRELNVKELNLNQIEKKNFENEVTSVYVLLNSIFKRQLNGKEVIAYIAIYRWNFINCLDNLDTELYALWDHCLINSFVFVSARKYFKAVLNNDCKINFFKDLQIYKS